MGVLPNGKLETIQFCENHIPVWLSAPPASIGLTEARVNALKTKTETARNSYTSAESTRQTARAATVTYNSDARLMREDVADVIRQIKAYAEAQAVPDTVYAAAEIPVPLPPAPQPAPGIPTNFTIGLELSGAITLRWKCTNATPSSGTFFNISRTIGAATTSIATVGMKKFTDSTLPRGTSSVTYQVTPVRSDVSFPPSAGITVQFGVGGDGSGLRVTNATVVTPDGVMKMAA